MKIISKFVDYYDSIANIYGIDKRIVFDRTKKLQQILPLNASDFLQIPDCAHYRFTDTDTLLWKRLTRRNEQTMRLINLIEENKIVKFYILSVCGKPFYVGMIEGYFDHVTFESHPKEYVVISGEFEDLLLEKLTGWREEKISLDVPRTYLTELHKLARSPIILIISNDHNDRKKPRQFLIDENVPNLSKIRGFTKRYSKEQVYQDISYWIANILNESPDIQPSGKPPQSDKEKILSHGLDLKQSFRHR